METVEKWGCFEISFPGKTEGNPFTDYEVIGEFAGTEEKQVVYGFYDGNGIYKVRFMPSFEGKYTYRVEGSFSEEAFSGEFLVTKPSLDNHGIVRVANTFHFAYEDGTPYYPVGTTCYVWELQSDALIERTLKSLEEAGFNKIRFCIFPKHYDYNLREPRSYPYEGTPMDSSVLTRDNFLAYTDKTEGNHFDFKRFHPEHFQHIEACILKLQKLGIEADLIVMHPYDRWGFSSMKREEDDLYWNYVLRRFGAYRNVWWSLANEYDCFPHKTQQDWEHYAELIVVGDPYRHLRSIHNCIGFYDYTRPWITHCSIQRQELFKTAEMTDEWRERFKKPVVLDEIAYEGNIEHGWGNISGEEMNRRFWEGAMRGGYPGHGETYMNDKDILWWSHGGELHGESHKRVKFLLGILKETPGYGLAPDHKEWDSVCAKPEEFVIADRTGYRIYYYSLMRPSFRKFHFDDTTPYRVEVIDTWNMTIEDRGVMCGAFRVELPGRSYMAIRVRKEM